MKKIGKDCVLQDEFEQFSEKLSFFEKDRVQFTKIFLKDCCRTGIVEIKEIEYISYSSISRETEFHLQGDKVFCIKKKFSDIEKIEEKVKDFIKLERGLIINISLINFLDYKREKVIFKSDGFIYLSKLKLKKLEKYLKSKNEDSFFL